MKQEMGAVRTIINKTALTDFAPLTPEQRKAVRLVTDSLFSEALFVNNIALLPERLVQVIMVVATVMVMREMEPDVPHFVAAATELIEDARKVMDKGLQTDDPLKTMTGAVMLEIVVRGLFHTLGLNYSDALKKEVES